MVTKPACTPGEGVLAVLLMAALSFRLMGAQGLSGRGIKFYGLRFAVKAKFTYELHEFIESPSFQFVKVRLTSIWLFLTFCRTNSEMIEFMQKGRAYR